MALLTSHVLDSVTGQSVSGTTIELYRLSSNNPEKIFEVQSDNEGRISETFERGNSYQSNYALVFHSGKYLLSTDAGSKVKPLMENIVVRINVMAYESKYHILILIAPHSYTVWWSGKEKKS